MEHQEHKHPETIQHHSGGMGMRGITRPMAEKQMRQHHQEHHQNQDDDGKEHKMTPEMREQMLHMHHMQTLWVYWLISPARWRTMPWMGAFFGVLVIPLGLVHIFLVISQPVVVGAWCTFCLLAAALMLPMIPLEVDEVIAMVQFMKKKLKKGEEGFWKLFWKGGTIESEEKDEAPEMMKFPQKPMAVYKASIWGMSFP